VTLEPGTSIGPFRITARLGAGGMGEVYRATDSRLDRDVAIKVLSPELTGDREHAERFRREAQLLAQLHHPNIASVFGIEELGETGALVMELVEGPTLADRLQTGPLSVEECLAVALQIARALEEAHEKGIVHRDLKPQNVKAAPGATVKVLDFGLAKALEPMSTSSASPTALAHSPTIAFGATVQGVILGTAAYMAPEQAKGMPVDRRADIWAFGVVLWEMLSGRRLFHGDSVAEILVEVLKGPVDLDALPADTPPAVRRLVARCLERDPKRRLRDIGEARVLLEGPLDGVPVAAAAPPSEVKRLRWAAAVAGLLALAGMVVAGWSLARAPGPGPAAAHGQVIRFHILPPEGVQFGSADGPLVLSPDGSSIAFRVEGPDTRHLAVRRLDTFATVALPGTEGGYEPFWSPDGRFVGFFGEQLSMVDAGGLQPPQLIAPITDGRGASWASDGILYAPAPGGGIFLVQPGGKPRQITTVDRARGETGHLRPQHLPGADRFLFLVRSEDREVAGLYVGSLDGKLKRRLLASEGSARFASPDLLLLRQEGRLVARRLDLSTLEVAPAAWVLAENVDYVAQFDLLPVSVSNTGRLAYHPLSTAGIGQLTRIDQAGTALESLGEPGDRNLDLAPDGKRLATERRDAAGRTSIWIRDLERGGASRLATDGSATGPVWSPDGRFVAYAQTENTVPLVSVRPAAGGPPRVVLEAPYLIEPIDWSPDGRTLLVELGNPGERSNLVLVPADGSGTPIPFANGPANELSGRFSPDGEHIAYVSDETGRVQIYVAPVARTGARWLASPSGGDAPRWSRNGEDLFYVEPGERDGAATLMSVAVSRRGDELDFGLATKRGPISSIDYEVMPGGGILVSAQMQEGGPTPPVLIDGWQALLAPR
jgi:Tol biopolymer transport system component